LLYTAGEQTSAENGPRLCYNAAMVIDFHTHVFPPQVKRQRAEYVQHDPLFAQLYANPKAVLASAEDLIADMDLQSVERSVILNIAWQSSPDCQETNRYLLESAARHRGRLIPFGMVRLDDPASALPEIDYLARNGAKGVGEVRPQPAWLANPELIRPVLQALIDHRMILLTHSSEPLGHIYAGKGNLTPQLIQPLIAAFPELVIVCAHWGGGLPFYALMPEVKNSFRNVYFDCAASPYLYRPEIYPLVAKMVGAQKILFGSDYPLLKPARLLPEIRSQGLNEDDKDWILAGNAARLLGLEER
jgi:predicted TIM-barrel fold metal-dependent hydrolase